MKIRPEQFADAVNKILQDYGDEARETMEEIVTATAKESAKKMKSSGSFGGKGTYKKGWKAKIEKSRLSVEAVVYNPKQYYLTHLLEFGHAKQNGGRTRAFTHIEPVNDWTQEEVVSKLEEKL